MKKLLVMMFLMVGPLSYASSGKVVKPIVVSTQIITLTKTVSLEDSAVWCCTIGGFRACGAVGTNQCAIALAGCQQAGVCGGGGGGGCITGCGGGGTPINYN